MNPTRTRMVQAVVRIEKSEREVQENENFVSQAKELQETLRLKWSPISITFAKDPPTDIARIARRAAAGCTYWKLAAEGNVFYTEASDHYGCSIGAYTHGVELPAEQGKELESMIAMMVSLSYLKMEEVPSIRRRESSFGFAIYAPLAKTTLDPDIVLVRGNETQMMLLPMIPFATEKPAVLAASESPTCAMIPAVLKTQESTISLGCIVNRIYTELGDHEICAAISGVVFSRTLAKLASLTVANFHLEQFYSVRTLNSES